MFSELLSNPLLYTLVAIYTARKTVLLLRELIVLRNEWVRRER